MESIDTNLQFYSNQDPSVNETVLVKFTAMKDGFFDGVLLEYPGYTIIMTFQDATKKRRVYSWSKIVPLEKNMVATIENVDIKLKTAQVSIAYFEDMEEGTQEKLMKPFLENKLAINFIKSLCMVHKYEFNMIWTKLIHYIDTLRQEYNEDIDKEDHVTLWKYFCDNIDSLEEYVEEAELDHDVYTNIKELYDKRTSVAPHNITTKVGIVSPGGTGHTKTLLSKVLQTLKFKYTFKYDATPNYILESNSSDSSEDDHKKFIKTLETEAMKCNPKVFIKA
jgi:translation initiation factor 2 alpha subunit (eIF-2alpha)